MHCCFAGNIVDVAVWFVCRVVGYIPLTGICSVFRNTKVNTDFGVYPSLLVFHAIKSNFHIEVPFS